MPRSFRSTIEAANAALLVEGDLDAIPEFFAPDYVAHLTGEDIAGGHAAIRKVIGAVRRAFPDPAVEVEILAEGRGRVAWQRTLRAVHRGAYAGFPATGRRIVWREMFTSRFEGGRFAEDWAISDLAERLLRARRR